MHRIKFATDIMKVTVITPNYNASGVIAQTLDSLLSQTYTNWEALIVDDCSTDNSVEIIKSYAQKDKRIKLIQCAANNGGPAIPRNMGIAAAQGDYIAFLDSDDLWLPEKLEIQMDFMLSKKALLSSTSYALVDEQGIDLKKVVRAVPVMNFNTYLRNTSIGFSSAVIRRDILEGISFKKLPVAEDFAFWLDVFRKGDTMIGIDKVLMKYRVQKKSLSSNKFKSAGQIWRIYRDIEGFSTIRSLYYFSGYAFNAVKKRM